MSSSSSSIKRAMHHPGQSHTYEKRSVLYRIGATLLLPAWVMAGFFGSSIAVVTIVYGLQGLGLTFDGLNETVFGTVVNAIIYAVSVGVVIGIPALIWRRKRHVTAEIMGLQRLPSWKDIFLSPAAFILYLIASTAVMALVAATLPSVDLQQAQDTGFMNISQRWEYLLAFLMLVVIAPIAEEVVFRGYLFGKLRRFAPTWVAIIITSLMFAIAHLQLNVGIDVFVLSIFLCLLRVISGSLWPSILLHMLKNGLAYYLIFFTL